MRFKDKTFIDLFAGIGGFHQALTQFGAKCLFASEWDKHAAQTYQTNYGIKPAGDITQIPAQDIPKHDILCAGFPCQAFSVSGKQKGFEDTRGTLFFDIARIIKHHKPQLILLENVKNFIKHDKGNTLKTVLTILDDLGYQVFYQVLNASNFGLPQNRERVYLVGFLKQKDSNSTHTTSDSAINFHFPSPLNVPIALQDILQDNPSPVKPIDRSDIKINKSIVLEEDIFGQQLLPNRPLQIGIVNKGGQGERIYHPLGHSITLSAYGGGVGSKTGLYQIGDVIRKLSPRECARLQGFPEDFKIVSTTTQAYKQFGNSVAINVLVEIIKQIEKVPE